MPPKGSKKLDAKKAARLRRHELEAQKRRLARRERRRTWTLASLAVLLGGGIVAAVAVPQALEPKPVSERSLASFGTSEAKAGCDAPKSPKPSGGDPLIGPGTAKPKQTKASYPTVPPVGGAHYATPLTATGKNFFPAGEHPKVEQLVANELQGDTVVWYSRDLSSGQVKTLRQLAERMAVDNPNFLVAPWDTAYGSLPAGKPVAFATKGHYQLCAKVSGAAAQTFVQRFPAVAPAPSTPAATPSGSASQVPTGSATPSGSRSPKATRTPKAGGASGTPTASPSPSSS